MAIVTCKPNLLSVQAIMPIQHGLLADQTESQFVHHKPLEDLKSADLQAVALDGRTIIGGVFLFGHLVSTMLVAPEARGRGTAKQMVEALIREAERNSIRKFEAWVRIVRGQVNLPAKKTLEAVGFRLGEIRYVAWEGSKADAHLAPSLEPDGSYAVQVLRLSINN